MYSRDYRVQSDKNMETFILRGLTALVLIECFTCLIITILKWNSYGLHQIFLRIVSVFFLCLIGVHILFPWVLCQFLKIDSYYTVLSILTITKGLLDSCFEYRWLVSNLVLIQCCLMVVEGLLLFLIGNKLSLCGNKLIMEEDSDMRMELRRLISHTSSTIERYL